VSGAIHERFAMKKKFLLFVAVASIGVVSVITPAFAATTVDIGQGNVGTKIGTASYTRTLQGDGSKVIGVSIDITGSGEHLTKVHVCTAAEPFTKRIPPGQCQFVFDGVTGTTFTRDLNIGSGYVGKQVCLQNHVDVALDADATVTNTGYAAWVAGSPFYGSVCLDPTGTQVPVGTWGALGLSAVVAVALGALFVVSRRSSSNATQA